MKKHWRPSKQLLLGLACIEHGITKELSLAGKYGEVWIVNNSTCAAIIYSNRIARRFLPKDQWPVDSHDETKVTFQAQDLAAWVKRLAVPKKPVIQAAIANRDIKIGSANSILEVCNTDFFSSEAKNQSQHAGEGPPVDSPMETNFPLQTQNAKFHRDSR